MPTKPTKREGKRKTTGSSELVTPPTPRELEEAQQSLEGAYKHKGRKQLSTLAELKEAASVQLKQEREYVNEVSPDIEFNPTMFHRRIKAKFLYNYHSLDTKWIKDHPVKSLTNAQVVQIAEGLPTSLLMDKGFMCWVKNVNSRRENVNALGDLALEALQELATNTDPKAQGPRVSACKILLQLDDAFPKYEMPEPKKAKVLDEEVAKALPSQLEDILKTVLDRYPTLRVAIQATGGSIPSPAQLAEILDIPAMVEEEPVNE
jgi:hypothetical protein